MGRFKNYIGLTSAAFIGVVSLVFIFGRPSYISYIAPDREHNPEITAEEEKVVHLSTPEPVKAIYMTSWVAGTQYWRDDLIKFIDSTEINSVVIDVKDYSGRVAFETDDPYIKALGSSEERISDIKDFIKELHDKNIYVIARISVFQDPYFVYRHPEFAVKRKDGSVWKDYKGLTWVDPAAKEFWEYTVLVAKASEKVGFDELNFDYIRFPSDGNMRDIHYDFLDHETPKAEVLSEFFSYLKNGLQDTGVPLSADLFGMVTINYDDLNIGQVLEKAEPYFDYIAPMVYPSHYPENFNGLPNPAEYPYEVVHQAMMVASSRLLIASSTPSKLRPWIQDFDLGAIYDAEKVRAQIQAVYDAGLTSWMVWDAGNKYTRDAYDIHSTPDNF